MIVCQECGNAAPSNDGFCSSCGVLLEWSGEAVAAPAPPPPVAPPLAQQLATVQVKPDTEAVRPAPVPLLVDPGYDGLFCSACGTRNADGRRFCRYCGSALDITVDEPVKTRWWQRIFRRRKPKQAGERPRNFRSREAVAPAATEQKKRRTWRLPSRLPLSRFAPVLVVLGLVGIGLGPARFWITQQADKLLGNAKHHVQATYAPVVPVAAGSSSTAKGHRAAAAIDGVKQTWWQSDGHANGIGESITVRFANPTDLDAIGVLSGVDGEKYRAQARPQTLTVTADGKPAGQITVKDKADFQTAKIKLRGVTRLTVVITSSFPGQKGNAVALRELQFFQLS